MSNSNSSTRGKRALALRHAGGTVRDITADDLLRIFERLGADTPTDALVDKLVQLLYDRLYHVDLVPSATRVDAKRLDQIASCASKLNQLLHPKNESKLLIDDLLTSIKFEPSEIRGDREGLSTWLVRLENYRYYFEEVDVPQAYMKTIKKLSEIIEEAGYENTVSESSWFFSFLSELENKFPKLVFPAGSVPSGRVRYVLRAKK